MSSGALPCCGPPDPCQTLLQEIQEFLNELKRRAAQLRANEGNLPLTRPATPHPRYQYRSIAGERQQFRDTQRGLRNRLTEYNDRGCGPPPPSDAWRFATMETPQAAPRPDPQPQPQDNTVRNVAVAGAGVGVGYVVYRIIRLIPSIFAPPTLIPNLAIP